MNSDSNWAQRWSAKGVLLATSALPFAFTPTAAYAQSTTETATPAPDAEPEAPTGGAADAGATDDANTIVVTGIRGALETARNIKRNSDTFVDSITASDVSTLPDLSVAEAIGRIPGVSVSRFPSGGASPDFPSPEGRGNLIRGLGFVRSEFNGRDAFTANRGRALDWSAIPPELVGAVDVFKNQTADLIEGGIGGTINLRTLEPFDRKGRVIAVALDATYADLRKKWSPSGSIVLGNRWQTNAGEFGLMASYSKSILKSMINGWQQNTPTPRVVENGAVPEAGQFIDVNRLNEFGTGYPGTGNFQQTVDPSRIIGTTTGFQLRTNEVDRDRTSWYGAAQWRNDNIKATAKYVRSKTKIDNIERTFETWPDHNPSAQQGITNLVLDPRFNTAGTYLCNGEGGRLPDNTQRNPGDCETLIPIGGGLMQSGTVTNSSESWTGAYGQGINSLGLGGVEDALTSDISLNVQWDMTDRLTANFDVHKTKAEASYRQIRGGLQGFYNYNIKHGLDDPSVEIFIDPRTGFNPGNTRFTGDDNGTRIPQATSSADLNGTNWLYASETFQVGDGDLKAIRGDLNYDLTGGDGAANWFKAIKFGARFAERQQTNRETGENWGGIAPAWAGGYGIVGTFQDTSAFEAVDFSDFFRGGVVQGPNNHFVFFNEDLLNDYSAFIDYMESEPQTRGNHPFAARGTSDGSKFGAPTFRPEDISDITEKTRNAYVRFDFGSEFDNGMAIDGNIGVRYVRTDLDSEGFRAFRPFTADAIQPEFAADGTRLRTPDAESRDDPRDFLPEAVAYSAQAAIESNYKTKDTHWLPSFNVKWNLNPEMLIRFGVSKGLSRPNIQDLRGSQEWVVSTGRTNFPQITDRNDPLFGIDRGAQNITINRISVSRGNPQLKPTTAWNYDLSYEYYFKGGYFSAAAFYKNLRNIIENGEQQIGTEVIGGTEYPVVYSGLVNQARAKVKGFELAYQQFYDFLPGILSNTGIQANYTFVKASADAPGGALDVDGDGFPDGGQLAVPRFGVDDLLGQSKHIANAVGIYQDDKLELRLAYNWRSRYLTTYRDYVSGMPIYMSANGNLDASVKYQFTPEFQFRASLANILDSKNKSRAQIDQAGTMYDRSSFLMDRRLVVGVLAQF